MVGGEEDAYLGAFTSAPLSMSKRTTRSLPSEQAACRGRTPSNAEFIGWPCSRAYFTRPMSPEAAALCKPRCGTVEEDYEWEGGGKEEGEGNVQSRVTLYFASAL